MNWYLENAGAAEGPYDDLAMTELARGHKVASDSLVWHAGLEAWTSVAALAPSWWGAALPAHEPEPMTRKKVVMAQQPLPATSADAPEVTPKRRLAAPVAPNEGSAEPKESGGLLKKIFGFGKKKK
jgi:GYF domain 2